MILAAVGVMFSCQRVELPEEVTQTKPEGAVSGEATISFSALLPSSPQTKALGDEPFGGEGGDDIRSMHLVVFDENGMLVETREATILPEDMQHDSGLDDNKGDDIMHLYERGFQVTLTVTDQPRIIHFIANCPVDQIIYGHETSVIGNLYVEKDTNIPGLPETAYWARIEVDDLIIEGAETSDPHFANPDVTAAFRCVPMLRNFAQVVVIKSDEADNFELLGFTLYNTVDMGTVAPYNSSTQEFQQFINPATGQRYKYPVISNPPHNYQGHALAAAELKQDFVMDASSDDGYKWFSEDEPFFMYERKVSVKTDIETDWNESPPHVIIKGRYNGKVNYYKVDLVHNIIDDQGTPDDPSDDLVSEIRYYNILRNFKYQFTITEVLGEGYDSVEAAVAGSTSNNLSGSSTTSKFTNISDNKGRLWVSYTDMTLVTKDDITLYYKYVPDIGQPDVIDNDLAEDGGPIILENFTDGEVIISAEVEEEDVTSGEWAGFRRIDIKVHEPLAMTKEQTVVIKTDNAKLTRQVRYTLRQKYTMEVACTPQVESKIGEEVQVDIRLPGGLTENMFPLDLAIEVYDMTLSPDAAQNTIPVETGLSTIPLDEKIGKPSFYYVKTIATKDDYDNLPTEGTHKVVTTHWLTNIAKNASTVYVTNRYFNPGSASFGNGMSFSDVMVNVVMDDNRLFYGVGETTSISFKMNDEDTEYRTRNVTVRLSGLQDASGNTVLTVTPGNDRTVTVSGLATTSKDGMVSFSVEAEGYITASSQMVTRHRGEFIDLTVGDGRGVLRGADVRTSVSFRMDDHDLNVEDRTVIVRFDGLVYKDGSSELTISPVTGGDVTVNGKVVTVGNLYTLNAEGMISFSVEEADGIYSPASSQRFGRRDRAFTGLSFSEESLGADAGESVDFTFEIPEDEYVDGMTVNVELSGLEPRDGTATLSPVTRTAGYVYVPSDSGTQTLYLQTTGEDVDEYSVALSADGFENAEDSVPLVDEIIIPAGNLVTILSDRDFSNQNQFKTIYLYSVNPETNTDADPIASYTIERVQTSSKPAQYREARNPDPIILPSDVTTVFIKYKQSNNKTYYGSFDAQEASQEGVEVDLR